MPVSLRKPNTDAQQKAALLKVAADTVATADTDLRTFKSGNTGLYVSRTIKAKEAREDLGIDVPAGGKVKVQVTLIVVDPENSDS